jgi:hypothetical protein
MKLINVYDLRERDNNNKPMPIEKGEGHICENCGREHGKVFVVSDEQGSIHEVGSICCKKMFGWQPTSTQIIALAEAQKLVSWMNKNNKSPENLGQLVKKYYADDTQYFREMIYDFASRHFHFDVSTQSYTPAG